MSASNSTNSSEDGYPNRILELVKYKRRMSEMSDEADEIALEVNKLQKVEEDKRLEISTFEKVFLKMGKEIYTVSFIEKMHIECKSELEKRVIEEILELVKAHGHTDSTLAQLTDLDPMVHSVIDKNYKLKMIGKATKFMMEILE